MRLEGKVAFISGGARSSGCLGSPTISDRLFPLRGGSVTKFRAKSSQLAWFRLPELPVPTAAVSKSESTNAKTTSRNILQWSPNRD